MKRACLMSFNGFEWKYPFTYNHFCWNSSVTHKIPNDTHNESISRHTHTYTHNSILSFTHTQFLNALTSTSSFVIYLQNGIQCWLKQWIFEKATNKRFFCSLSLCFVRRKISKSFFLLIPKLGRKKKLLHKFVSPFFYFIFFLVCCTFWWKNMHKIGDKAVIVQCYF